MEPHPEGGYFSEIHRDEQQSMIYYLLQNETRSNWRRLKKDEFVHYCKGSMCKVYLWEEFDCGEQNKPYLKVHKLGQDILNGERPCFLIPKNYWAYFEPTSSYCLINCGVVPPFDYADFEMASKDWNPE